MSDLAIELRPARPRFRADETVELVGTYKNVGASPLALAFWWNRTMRVTDEQGHVIAPGPGPVLPCGVAEDWSRLEPGQSIEHPEPLACTQPAGRTERIGWSYQLTPGTYRVALVFEAPPAHGFSQSAPEPLAFRGRVESNEVTIAIDPPAPRKPGFFSRLLGGS